MYLDLYFVTFCNFLRPPGVPPQEAKKIIKRIGGARSHLKWAGAGLGKSQGKLTVRMILFLHRFFSLLLCFQYPTLSLSFSFSYTSPGDNVNSWETLIWLYETARTSPLMLKANSYWWSLSPKTFTIPRLQFLTLVWNTFSKRIPYRKFTVISLGFVS